MAKAYKLSLAVLFAFAGLIRFCKLGEKQFWLDEIIQILHSSPSNFRDLLTAVTADRGGVPLDYLIQHAVISLAGTNEFTGRLHAAVFGTLTVVAFYFLAGRLLKQWTAFLATLLYAVYPLHHHYSQEGRPYALFSFLTVCSFILFIDLLKTPTKLRWMGYGLNSVFLLYASYFGIFVLFSQFAFLFTLMLPVVGNSFEPERRIDIRFIVKFVVVSLAAFAFLVPWIVFGIRTVYGYEPAPDVFGLRLASRIIRELGDQSTLLGAMLIGIAIIGILHLYKSHRLGHLSLLLCWSSLSLPFILLLLWMKDYFFVGRQLLFMTPALFMLIAVGIDGLGELVGRDRPRSQLLSRALPTAVLFAVSLSVIWFHIPERGVDFRMAGSFLRENVRPGDKVIAPRIESVLIYYFPQMPDHVMSEGSQESLDMLSGGSRIYVVECPYMTDADRERMEKLKSNYTGSIFRSTEFREIRVLGISTN